MPQKDLEAMLRLTVEQTKVFQEAIAEGREVRMGKVCDFVANYHKFITRLSVRS